MLIFAVILAIVISIVILMRPEVGVVLTIFTSIIWLIGSIRLPGIPFLGPSQISIALTLIAWILWATTRRIPLTYSPHIVPLGLFFLVVACSPFTAGAPFSSTVTAFQKYLMAFMPYFLISNTIITRPAVDRLVWVILSVMAGSLALALLELYLPGIEHNMGIIQLGARIDPSVSTGPIKRVTGGLGDGNWFSYTVATCVPLAVYLFRTTRRQLVQLLAAAMIGLMCYGIVLSYTRAGFIGLAAAMFYLLCRQKLPLLPIAAAVIFGLITSPLWVPKGFMERVLSVKYLKTGSSDLRKQIVGIAAELFMERPVFGYGYQQFGPLFMERVTSPEGREMARLSDIGDEPSVYLQAHNLFLDLGVSFGIAGAFFFAIFILFLFLELGQVQVRGSPMDEELATALKACFIAFLVCGLFGHSQEQKILWVLAGMVAGFRRSVLEGNSKG